MKLFGRIIRLLNKCDALESILSALSFAKGPEGPEEGAKPDNESNNGCHIDRLPSDTKEVPSIAAPPMLLVHAHAVRFGRPSIGSNP
jgi:hypothetical protein